MRWLLVMLALAACKSDAQKTCAKMSDLAQTCMKQLTGDAADEMERFCTVGLVQERGSNGSLADELYDAMIDCTKATTCDELTACFTRRGCTFMFASPTDTPHFQCWPVRAKQ